MKWILLAGAGLIVVVALLIFSGFADVPCQDGRWDETRQTCIPS